MDEILVAATDSLFTSPSHKDSIRRDNNSVLRSLWELTYFSIRVRLYSLTKDERFRYINVSDLRRPNNENDTTKRKKKNSNANIFRDSIKFNPEDSEPKPFIREQYQNITPLLNKFSSKVDGLEFLKEEDYDSDMTSDDEDDYPHSVKRKDSYQARDNNKSFEMSLEEQFDPFAENRDRGEGSSNTLTGAIPGTSFSDRSGSFYHEQYPSFDLQPTSLPTDFETNLFQSQSDQFQPQVANFGSGTSTIPYYGNVQVQHPIINYNPHDQQIVYPEDGLVSAIIGQHDQKNMQYEEPSTEHDNDEENFF